MPQAIAIQLPITAAATPMLATADASPRGTTGKAPVFSGMLSQLGRAALLSKVSAAGQAVAKATDTPASETDLPSNAPQPVAQPDQPVTRLAVPVLPTVERSVPSAAPPAVTPASGAPPHPRAAIAARSGPASETAAAPPADASGVAAGTVPTPVPPPALAPPASAPEQSQPREAASVGHAERPRLEGVAEMLPPAVSQSAGTDAASVPMAPADSSATVPDRAAVPSGAPVATPSETGALPILAVAQPVQPAASLALPAAAESAAATQPDVTAAAPVQQVSAALVSLAGTPGGGQRMTLRLEPAELGQVEIRIDRPPDAPAQVDISVQRPETLTLLLRDQPQLQHALDQAGVPSDGRGLTLHVAAPEPAASPGSVNSTPAASADLGQGGGNNAGAGPGGQARTAGGGDADPDDTAAPVPRWLRAGLDITA